MCLSWGQYYYYVHRSVDLINTLGPGVRRRAHKISRLWFKSVLSWKKNRYYVRGPVGQVDALGPTLLLI